MAPRCEAVQKATNAFLILPASPNILAIPMPADLDTIQSTLEISDSDQPDIPFDRFDHRVHLAAPYLFSKAERKARGRVEGNMRR